MFSREMVQTSRNKNFQDIDDRRWSKWFLFTFYEDLVHTTTKPMDTHLDDLKIDKEGHVILFCFLNPIMEPFINFNNDVFASMGFAIRDKMEFQLKKEGKVTVVDKGSLHLTPYEAPRVILITLTEFSIFGKMGIVLMLDVEFIGEDTCISDCLRDVRYELRELKIIEAKDCGYTTSDRLSFKRETYRVPLPKDNPSLKMEEDSFIVQRSNVRIDQDKTKETPFNFSSNNSFVLEKNSNSNSYAHIILNELDSSVLSDASNISNTCPLGSGIVPDNPRRMKVLLRKLKLDQSDKVYFLSSEPCNPQHSTVTDGTEPIETDLEVQNSDEDFHSSQESPDILVTEPSPPRAESTDTGEMRVVDLSPKVFMPVPDERSEQTTCQVPEPSGPCSKLPETFNSLSVVGEKGLPLAYGQFTEMLYEPVRERQPQPPPAEDSSLPLTREGTLQNTTPPHDEDTSLPLTGDRILQNMKQITWRLASMLHLQSHPVRHQDLADAGWFYDEDRDEFRCYCCPAARARGLWTRGDNPENLHQQMSPGCPHLNPCMAIGLHHSEVVDCEADTMVTECETVREDGNEVSRVENTDNGSCRPETDLTSTPLYQGISLAVGKAKFQMHCNAEVTDQVNSVSQLGYSKPDLSEHAVDGAQDEISLSEAVHSSFNYSSGQRGETGDSDLLLENETCDLAEDGENFPDTECLSCSGKSHKEDWVRGRRDPSHSASRSNSHEDDCGEAMTATSDLDVREGEEMISRLRSDAFLAAHDDSLSEQDSQIASNLGQVEEAPSSSTASPTFSQDDCRAFLSDGSSSLGRDTTGLRITGHADSETSNLYLSQCNGLTEDRESGNSSLSLQPVVTLSVSPVDFRHGETHLRDLSRNHEEDERAPHLPVPSPLDLAGDQPDTTITDATRSPHTS